MALLLVALGGAAGAAARYVVDVLVADRVGTAFPFGILLVNLSGAFLLGLLYALTAERGILSDAIRAPVFVGFLGAYTTFSTLMLDSWRLAEGGSIALAAANIIGSSVLGLVAVVSGLALGRSVG